MNDSNSMIDSHLESELLSAYVDDEVTASERATIERHLKTCRECRRELESLRWTVGLLRELPSVDVPRPLYVRQTDLEPASAPGWLDRLAAFAGTFRVLSYASAVSFMLVLVLTIAGTLPAGFGGAAQQPAGDDFTQFESAPAERGAALETEVVEEEAAVEEAAEPEAVQPTQAPAEEAPEAEDADDVGAMQDTESTVAAEMEAEITTVAEAEPETAAAPAEADGAEEPSIESMPQTRAAEPSPVDRLELAGWLLAITGLATLIFGGLARWLPRG